jgi:hypothetical protein
MLLTSNGINSISNQTVPMWKQLEEYVPYIIYLKYEAKNIVYMLHVLYFAFTLHFHTFGHTDLHPSPAPHFETFPCTFNLFSEVSNFQHHVYICPECIFFTALLLTFKSNLPQKFIFIFLLLFLFLRLQCCFAIKNLDFTFSVHFIFFSYHATQTVEIFHI